MLTTSRTRLTNTVRFSPDAVSLKVVYHKSRGRCKPRDFFTGGIEWTSTMMYVMPYWFYRSDDGTLYCANYDKIDRKLGELKFVKYASAPTLAAAWNKLPAEVRGDARVEFVELKTARKYIKWQSTYKIVPQAKIINFCEAVAQMCDADARVKAA